METSLKYRGCSSPLKVSNVFAISRSFDIEVDQSLQ